MSMTTLHDGHTKRLAREIQRMQEYKRQATVANNNALIRSYDKALRSLQSTLRVMMHQRRFNRLSKGAQTKFGSLENYILFYETRKEKRKAWKEECERDGVMA